MFQTLGCIFVLLAGLLSTSTAFSSRPATMVLENNQFKNMVVAIHESVHEDSTLIDTLKDFSVGLLPTTAAFLSRPATMVLENNQFKNMVVAIHESVHEDSLLIDTLKDTLSDASKVLLNATHGRAYFKEITILLPWRLADTLSDASKVLLNATHGRAYFKEITILLPSTWSGSYQAVTSENINNADVIISDKVRAKRSLPQARSYSGCGKQGVHILLSKDFLTNVRLEPYYNAAGKYFVHAFAQFRWGVFQEYAEAGETLFYYSLMSGHPEAIRCTMGIRGLVQKDDANHTICYRSIDPETGLYTPDCLWRPYPTRQRVQASMMNHQWIQAIQTFCNDAASYATQHSYDAPSKHNRLCNHRSTWDVISNTEDFSGGKNPPISSASSSTIVPTFKIVKATARRKRAVITLDNDLHFSDAAAHQLVSSLAHEASIHGVDVSQMSQIDMENQLTNNHAWKRSLRGYDEETHDTHPTVVLVKHCCVNHTLHSDSVHDPNSVSMISTKSGDCASSRHNIDNHYIEGESAGHTLYDRLREAVLKDHIQDSKYMLIQREDVHLQPGEQFADSVHLDPTVGQTTLVIVQYELLPPDVVIRSPSDVVHSTATPQCSVDRTAQLVKCVFENAESGEWHYVITSKDVHNPKFPVHKSKFSIIVSTTPSQLSHDPIVVRTSVETMTSPSHHLVLHVDVTQGSHPVVGLNVTARIETPSGDVDTLRLLDNGAGADNSKNDGIYSRYWTQPDAAVGVYHITATVRGREGQVHVAEETVIFPDRDHNHEDEAPIERVMTKRSLSGNLQRHVTLGSVHVASSSRSPSDDDVIPPSRVTDLKVVRHLEYRNTLVLTWTAPGDDLDHGKVHSYEVILGENIKDVRPLLRIDQSKSDYTGPGRIAVEEHEAVAVATETETLLWTIPPEVHSFAFSVRAVDEAGNKAALSNVATFGLGFAETV